MKVKIAGHNTIKNYNDYWLGLKPAMGFKHSVHKLPLLIVYVEKVGNIGCSF